MLAPLSSNLYGPTQYAELRGYDVKSTGYVLSLPTSPPGENPFELLDELRLVGDYVTLTNTIAREIESFSRDVLPATRRLCASAASELLARSPDLIDVQCTTENSILFTMLKGDIEINLELYPGVKPGNPDANEAVISILNKEGFLVNYGGSYLESRNILETFDKSGPTAFVPGVAKKHVPGRDSTELELQENFAPTTGFLASETY